MTVVGNAGKTLGLSVLAAVGWSMLCTGLLLGVECVKLALENPQFVVDIGSAFGAVILWYGVFAVVVGAAVGITFREPRVRCIAIAVVFYGVMSAKMFWLDAPLLKIHVVAALFAAFTCGVVFAGSRLVRRLEAPVSAPIVCLLAYVVTCKVIGWRWPIEGGRPLSFLFAPSTILIVVAGAAACALALIVLTRVEQRFTHGAAVFHGVALLALAVGVVIATRARTRMKRAHQTSASGVSADVYVLSVDAMREDALADYVSTHPESALATLVANGTRFRNVVTEGVSTYGVLSKNTFAGTAHTCAASLPGTLGRAGYSSLMLFGRYNKMFNGATCYDRFFSGTGQQLVSRFALPGLVGAALGNGNGGGLRSTFMPSTLLVDELQSQLADLDHAPVFAYLHFLDMHAPYVPASKAADSAYLHELERYMTTCYLVACDPNVPENANLIATVRSGYLATLDDVDSHVARVLRLARSRARPFIVIVTADHGELFGERGGYAHGGGFVPELLKVPFVVFDSRSGARGQRCELMRSGEALRVTLAAAAGQPSQYLDHDVVDVLAPSLGAAKVDRRAATIEFKLSAESRLHAGTWRNVHTHGDGTLPFPIATCEN